MTKDEKKIEINKKIEKLEDFKNSYEKKKKSYNKLLSNSLLSTNTELYETIDKTLDDIDKEITKINKTINSLEKIDLNNKKTNSKYNKKIEDINKEFIKNYMLEKKIVFYLIKKYNVDTTDKEELDSNTEFEEEPIIEESIDLEGNDTLIISEVLGKVIFPYNFDEVLEIMKKENYKTIEEVIDTRFTRPLSDFRFQFFSRYSETMKLVTERVGLGLLDAFSLAIEMMRKRYLHPAIIAACKTIDDLDVYLDCLDKGELDDFKIFNIKYELYPMVVNEKKTFPFFKHVTERIDGKH